MPRTEPALRRVRELYRLLPTIDCQRRCAHSCVPVAMSRSEAVNLGLPTSSTTTAARGPLGVPRCSMLTPEGACGHHDARPMICRLWGVSESMRCPHGCEPDGGRYLTDSEAMELLVHSFVVGGHELVDDARTATMMREVVRWPGVAELVLKFVRGDSTAAVPLRRALRAFHEHNTPPASGS